MAKYHPLLAKDKEITGQNFVCISFLEPQKESLVIEKERFVAKAFAKYFADESKRLFQFLRENPETKISVHMEQFYDPTDKVLNDLYEGFVTLNKETIEKEFITAYNSKKYVTERGIKVRGTFDTYEEAAEHAKKLSDDENKLFDIYVCTMGAWVPFAPKGGVDVEYYDDKLNELINHQDDEKMKKELEYEDRKRKMMASISEEKKSD